MRHELAFRVKKNVKLHYSSQSPSRNGWVTPRCTTIPGKCKFFCPSYAVNNESHTIKNNYECLKLMRVIQGMLKRVSHLIGKMTKVHIKAELYWMK